MNNNGIFEEVPTESPNERMLPNDVVGSSVMISQFTLFLLLWS
jgi:hypothetical protein